MATASSIGTFLDAVRAALLLRAGLSGVHVFTGPVDNLSIGTEAIVFAVDSTEVQQDYPTVPQREAFETYAVEGRIWIVKQGAGETAIKAARDRALAIMNEVQSACITDKTMSGSVRDLKLTSYKLEQFPIDGGRDCRIAFTIDVQAHYTAP
jgi:hypothetical protein